ncbi:Flp pilus assembly complex ATPase component TadA [Candidatus Collierbacteria bacterium]|nr:Flp pilus assembly complex ATPase component TadA [Candidatus Collierbacteria bacterium]
MMPTATVAVSGDLLDILLSNNDLTADQVSSIKMKSAQSGESIRQIIEDLKLVDEDKLARALAQSWSVPYFDNQEVALSPELLNLIPRSVAEGYQLLPIEINPQTNQLSVAMSNPQNLAAIDFIEKKSGKKVKVMMASLSRLKGLIESSYSKSLTGEVSKVLEGGKQELQTGVRVVTAESMAQVIKEPKIVEIVKKLLEHAIRLRASDIHIEPQETLTRIRYRIDGILEEKLILDREYHAALVSRIKILGEMKIDEKRIPQDGRFTFRADEQDVDLRISSLPTVHGEKIVMRLLRKAAKVPTLIDLGLRGRALKNLEQAVTIPHGIILITGPTGSGKTTTLYSLLTKLNTPRVNIVTLEDPVEYEMPGINQVQVNTQAGLTFASGLRSFLRQDPNIIMVGEIRDEETASLAIQASLTGHLVFSTVHTNSAAGALPRLLDMKAEPFLLASSMTAVVAQRVLRRICDKCKVSLVPEQAVIDDIKTVLGNLWEGFAKTGGETVELAKKQGAELVLFKGSGEACDKCGGSGYLGRIGIYEVLVVSEKIGRLIMERADAKVIEDQARSEAMILMKQDGYLKALEGITSIEEVIRVAQI